MLLRLALSTAARPSASALLVGKSSQAFLQQSKPSLNSLRQYARQPVRSARAPVEQVRTGPTLKERLMAPPSANGKSTLHNPLPPTESFFFSLFDGQRRCCWSCCRRPGRTLLLWSRSGQAHEHCGQRHVRFTL